MTPNEPNISDSARYSLTEAAALLGVHRNTLRNHIKALKIRVGYRRSNNRPFLTGRSIKSYWRSQW
jgi:predicted ArsR family transcriptional regulator